MKSRVLLVVMLSCFTLFLSAQEFEPLVGYSLDKGYQTNFKKNKAGDNWFISAGVGSSIYLGDQNDKASFGDRLSINPSLSVGKWINPYFGLRLNMTGGSLHGFDGENAEFMQHNKFFMGHVDVMYDVFNHLGRYNEKRVVSLIPWLGMGYGHRFKFEGSGRAETPTWNAGILLAFRLSDRVDLNLEGQGAIVAEHFNRIDKGRTQVDALFQTSLGVSYRLGKTNFEVIEPMNYALVNELNNKINQLRSENEVLSARPEKCPELPQVQPPVKAVNYYAETLVTFRIGRATIENSQQINLYNAAKMAKETGVGLKVIGYADKQTGTSTYNMQLSEKRAKEVAKVLSEKYDIPASRITVEWKGAEEQPYNTNDWNRVVIISAD